jgi:hypothetical protein
MSKERFVAAVLLSAGVVMAQTPSTAAERS